MSDYICFTQAWRHKPLRLGRELVLCCSCRLVNMSDTSNPDKSKQYKYIDIPLSEEMEQKLMSLPAAWEKAVGNKSRGNKPESKRLRNLVDFAFAFLDYLVSNGIHVPSPGAFDKFFATSGWAIYRSEKTDLLPNTTINEMVQDKHESISYETQLGRDLIEIFETDELEVIKPYRKEGISVLIKKLAAGYFAYQQLLANLARLKVPEPSVSDTEGWVKKYCSDSNLCHDLLELLLNMDTLPNQEEMTFLANKYKVRTRQLYKIYYLMHGCSTEHSGCDGESKNDDKCDCH